MKEVFGHRPGLTDLLRDRCGIVAVVMAASLPVFLGFLALSIDMGYAYWMRNMLEVTAESAALAATAQVGLSS
ncbi:MAG: TadE/TadG family type IV pilus assembly protein, partial [Gammaproteobacteria bacterium]